MPLLHVKLEEDEEEEVTYRLELTKSELTNNFLTHSQPFSPCVGDRIKPCVRCYCIDENDHHQPPTRSGPARLKASGLRVVLIIVTQMMRHPKKTVIQKFRNYVMPGGPGSRGTSCGTRPGGSSERVKIIIPLKDTCFTKRLSSNAPCSLNYSFDFKMPSWFLDTSYGWQSANTCSNTHTTRDFVGNCVFEAASGVGKTFAQRSHSLSTLWALRHKTPSWSKLTLNWGTEPVLDLAQPASEAQCIGFSDAIALHTLNN
ncbi:hypothetical protein EVAR_76504_1 [Eumeta japonica]|uniref:Uncharacterized protein n=1 Tax=Eumeta variegata TaxID=151549 RepID=A0A4C1T4P6_EUMVA|nr:hypothetical protein EVAR_76504_1 [Eumeta japonica]